MEKSKSIKFGQTQVAQEHLMRVCDDVTRASLSGSLASIGPLCLISALAKAPMTYRDEDLFPVESLLEQLVPFISNI